MNVLMCGETIPSETLYGGLNTWSIELTHMAQRSVAVSHSIIHIAVSYGNSTISGTEPSTGGMYSLTEEVVSAPSLNSFKSRLDELWRGYSYVQNNCFPVRTHREDQLTGF